MVDSERPCPEPDLSRYLECADVYAAAGVSRAKPHSRASGPVKERRGHNPNCRTTCGWVLSFALVIRIIAGRRKIG